MTHPIGTPETVADTLLIYRAVDRGDIAAQLTERFGSELVARTQDNAEAWVHYSIDGRPLTMAAADADPDRQAAETDPTDCTGALDICEVTADDGEGEATLISTADIAPLTTREKPAPFDARESKIVLRALRRMTHEPVPGVRREVYHFLSRKAPTPVRRATYGLLFRAACTLARIR